MRSHRGAPRPSTTGQGKGSRSSAVLFDLAQAACRVASYTADRFPSDEPDVVQIRGYVRNIEDYLDGYDLETGEPFQQ